LEGTSNFVLWKLRLQNLLEKVVVPPTDPKDKVKHKKKAVVAKRIQLDSMKDQLIPQIAKKKTPKDMYDAFLILYQSVNVSRKMLLKNKLNTTRMSKTDTITSYLMKIAELREHIVTIGGRNWG